MNCAGSGNSSDRRRDFAASPMLNNNKIKAAVMREDAT
jgi:hypothetical protein